MEEIDTQYSKTQFLWKCCILMSAFPDFPVMRESELCVYERKKLPTDYSNGVLCQGGNSNNRVLIIRRLGCWGCVCRRLSAEVVVVCGLGAVGCGGGSGT